jgi:hypothetical protein
MLDWSVVDAGAAGLCESVEDPRWPQGVRADVPKLGHGALRHGRSRQSGLDRPGCDGLRLRASQSRRASFGANHARAFARCSLSHPRASALARAAPRISGSCCCPRARSSRRRQGHRSKHGSRHRRAPRSRTSPTAEPIGPPAKPPRASGGRLKAAAQPHRRSRTGAAAPAQPARSGLEPPEHAGKIPTSRTNTKRRTPRPSRREQARLTQGNARSAARSPNAVPKPAGQRA